MTTWVASYHMDEERPRWSNFDGSRTAYGWRCSQELIYLEADGFGKCIVDFSAFQSGLVNEDHHRLGRQRQVWVISFVDKRVGGR